MTSATLQQVIDVAQRLSPREKYQLIEAVAHSLTQADALEARSSAFVRGHTLNDLIDAQQPPIVNDIDALGADFWPDDESADDFNNYIATARYP